MATRTSKPRASASAVTKKLAKYRSMRDFARTPEPAGKREDAAKGAEHAAESALSFVIQKHAASHLHYDFRLEHEGVFASELFAGI